MQNFFFMKPKDLIFPFIEKEKRVFFDVFNRICYIPPRVQKEELSKDFKELFLKDSPCHLEIGSGNGEWVCEKALLEPDKIWFALEMRFDRVRKIWSKMKNHHIQNLWILCGLAEDILSDYIPRRVLDHISINFPDPWPKKRHAKNRLIQSPFLDCLALALKNEGTLDLLTDDENYFQQMKEVCSASSFEKIALFEDTFCPKRYGSSYFMRLWQEKQKNFYFLKYKNHVHNTLESLT